VGHNPHAQAPGKTTQPLEGAFLCSVERIPVAPFPILYISNRDDSDEAGGVHCQPIDTLHLARLGYTALSWIVKLSKGIPPIP
jgi:hypothetical protein